MKAITGVAMGALAMLLSGTSMAADEYQKRSAVSAPDLSTSYKSSDLMDLKVQDQKNEDLGKISELIVDKDGKVSHVVLTEGGVAGVGGNDYIVPWDRLRLSEREQIAQIDVSKDALSSEFAAFEEDMPTAGEKKEEKQRDEEKSSKPSDTNP